MSFQLVDQDNRLFKIWSVVEECVNKFQLDWVSEHANREEANLREGGFIELLPQEIAEIKRELENQIRLGLKAYLWYEIETEQLWAITSHVFDFIFHHSNYLYRGLVSQFNPHCMSFDSFSCFMNVWCLMHGEELNSLNIQERNLRIKKKIEAYNKWLNPTPFSDKLLANIIIAQQKKYVKQSITESLETINLYEPIELGMRLMKKRSSMLDDFYMDFMQRKIKTYQQNLCSVSEKEESYKFSVPTLLNNFLYDYFDLFKDEEYDQDKDYISLMDLRMICIEAADTILSRIFLEPELKKNGVNINSIPMGFLGTMQTAIVHSFFCAKANTDPQTLKYKLFKIDLTKLDKDIDGLSIYANLYLDCIEAGMFYKLATYNKENMTEIVTLFLNQTKLCMENQLQRYKLDNFITLIINNHFEKENEVKEEAV
jgi:hypothetical protein